MALAEVIAQIDAEITKLQQARNLLAETPTAGKSRRGRPKGSKNSGTKRAGKKAVKTTRG